MFVYSLKNAQTADVTPVLNAIFGSSTSGNLGTTTGTRSAIGSNSGFGGGTGGGGGGGGGLGGGTGGGGGRGGGGGGGRGGGGGGGGGLGGGGGGGLAGGGGGGGLGGSTGGGGLGGGGRGGATGGGLGVGGAGNRGSTTASAGGLQGQAYFVPNQDTNAILVYLTDAKFEARVRAIIDKLDRPVPQVVIKVLIAEVTHTNDEDIGFEFGGQNLASATDIFGNTVQFGPTAGTDYGLSQASGGLKIGLVEGQVSATLRALADEDKLDVISRPYILAKDNQEAYMIIGQEVPYITNSQVTSTGDTINSVTYREVGVILDVIPHINPEGLVTMDIAPQVSQLDPGSGVPITSNVFAPTFTIRQARAGSR